jgi:hypothetical protein
VNADNATAAPDGTYASVDVLNGAAAQPSGSSSGSSPAAVNADNATAAPDATFATVDLLNGGAAQTSGTGGGTPGTGGGGGSTTGGSGGGSSGGGSTTGSNGGSSSNGNGSTTASGGGGGGGGGVAIDGFSGTYAAAATESLDARCLEVLRGAWYRHHHHQLWENCRVRAEQLHRRQQATR